MCDWLLLYIAAGGLAGFAVSAPFTQEPTCWPYHGMWGVIESNCPHAALNIFWTVILGIPRLAILPPALGVALAADAIQIGEPFYILDGLGYWIASVPLVAIVALGFLYWKRYSKPIGVGLVTVIFLEVLVLGLEIY